MTEPIKVDIWSDVQCPWCYIGKRKFEKGVEIMLSEIAGWRDAPVWTVETIANATKDWFKYLAGDEEGPRANSSRE